MLPSFYLSNDKARPWSIARAAACGAAVGAVAVLFKTFGPLHGPFAGSIRPGGFVPMLPELAVAVIGFALLCAVAAALRNFIAQRLIWPDA